MITDFLFVFNWWGVLFLIGVIFLPLTSKVFSSFFDRGYIFSKTLGILILSYFIFLFGTLKILPFTQLTILLILAFLFLLNAILVIKVPPSQRWNLLKASWKVFILEELIFFIALFFWSYIRAHEPSIHGLEKYMDFGFVNSILRAEYFPPKDMWYAPLPINYYYFGHLVTAVLTKLSGISSTITYNLMIATLFAFTFTASFSIGTTLISIFTSEEPIRSPRRWHLVTPPRWIICGLLTAALVTLAGNLHTIYAFFSAYNPDTPVPFWQLNPLLNLSSYWYPNATRFIPFTIHEFPIYSFVVSDLHGHVLNIPLVLLTIALLLNILISKSLNIFKILLLAFLLAVMYMTNVWDGIIYFLLTALVTGFVLWGKRKNVHVYYRYIGILVVILGGVIALTLPFNINFKPFVSGIGVICTPEFLTKIGKLGPFLFEPDHCQRSPLWQLIILHGFWYFWTILFLFRILDFGHFKLFRNWKLEIRNLLTPDIFVLMLILISTLLILAPEFVYAKDIYPAHYRANTMFKLGYQAFIMLGIASAYIIVRMFSHFKSQISNLKSQKGLLLGIWSLGFGTFLLFLVAIYPYFSINSYYSELKNYQGLDGFSYLRRLYPNDYEAVLWLRNNIKGQPTILEAQGDSYTDYARVSANTGLPTVIGWPVHEWLWRGSFDVTSPRIADVKTLYETGDLEAAEELIKKYAIKLVLIGDLERKKYQNIYESKFGQFGKIIFESGQTHIYSINLDN